MTVFEMHLQLNQRLQEVASYKRDKFRPEEIDLALNKAVYRLLEQGTKKKFQDNQINLSHVSALVQKNKTLNTIIPDSSSPLYEDNVDNVYSVLPPDFYWLINGRAEIVTDPLNCETAPTLPTTPQLEYTAVVPFPALDAAPYFDNVSIVSSVLGTLYTSPSSISAGFVSSDSKYFVINNIIETLYRKYTTIKVYWERYRDTYYADSFIFVATVPIGTMTVTSGGQASATVSTQTSYTIYNRGLISSLPSQSTEIKSTTNKAQDILYDALTNNKFYATRSEQPVMTQTQDYLIYYFDESFLITRSYYDYIRKPRTISLALNQSCELADTTHPRIIDLSLEILRLDTKDQTYSATVQDTELRTN